VGRILLHMKKQMLLNGNQLKATWLLLILYSSEYNFIVGIQTHFLQTDPHE
jgi:hypothetical protein